MDNPIDPEAIKKKMEEFDKEANRVLPLPEERKEARRGVKRRPYLAVLIVICCSYTAIGVTQLLLARWMYQTKMALYYGKKERPPHTFFNYLTYRFSYWLAWRESAYTVLVVGIFCVFVTIGAISYCLFEDVAAPAAAFQVFVWLVNPDAGVREKTFGGRLTGFMMSLGGLMIFAFVISMVHEGFDEWLQQFRDGLDPVIESGHTVILGFTDATILLIEELCKANEQHGGITIAVLCERPKVEVEAIIQASSVEFRGSRIVVRSGVAQDLQHLTSVSVATCSQVILMADPAKEHECRDASALYLLFLLRGQGWPLQGTALVVCSLVQNEALLKETGGPNTQVVLLGSFVAKLMMLCSRGWGLGMAVNELMGVSGNTFSIQPVPDDLVGKTFLEASRHFPEAVLVGLAETLRPSMVRRGTRVAVIQDFEHGSGNLHPKVLHRGQMGEVVKVDETEDVHVQFPDLREPRLVKKDDWGKVRVASHHVHERMSLAPDSRRELKRDEALVLLAQDRNIVPGARWADDHDPLSSLEGRRTAHDHDPLSNLEVDPTLTCSAEASPIDATSEAATPATAHSAAFTPKAGGGQVVLFLGFNEWIGLILLELDHLMPPESSVITFAPEPPKYRDEELQKMQRDWSREFTNIEVTHIEGELASYYELEDLLKTKISEDRQELALEVSRVFVLLPKSAAPEAADACAVTTTLQVRDIMRQRGIYDVPVVPQISDSRSNVVCEGACIWDYVVTSELEAKVIAMYTTNPLVGRLLSSLTSYEDPHVKIAKLADFAEGSSQPDFGQSSREAGHGERSKRSLALSENPEAYVGAPAAAAAAAAEEEEEEEEVGGGASDPAAPRSRRHQGVTFFEASQIVSRRDMVLLGWTEDGDRKRRVVLNPGNKNARRRWSPAHDRLMVLSKSYNEGDFVARSSNLGCKSVIVDHSW